MTYWLSKKCFLFQLRYGEPVIRRAVPLALALISASNPKLQILDTLSKFSHDSDPEVAHNAILAMGIVGAGEYTCVLVPIWSLLRGHNFAILFITIFLTLCDEIHLTFQDLFVSWQFRWIYPKMWLIQCSLPIFQFFISQTSLIMCGPRVALVRAHIVFAHF